MKAGFHLTGVSKTLSIWAARFVLRQELLRALLKEGVEKLLLLTSQEKEVEEVEGGQEERQLPVRLSSKGNNSRRAARRTMLHSLDPSDSLRSGDS